MSTSVSREFVRFHDREFEVVPDKDRNFKGKVTYWLVKRNKMQLGHVRQVKQKLFEWSVCPPFFHSGYVDRENAVTALLQEAERLLLALYAAFQLKEGADFLEASIEELDKERAMLKEILGAKTTEMDELKDLIRQSVQESAQQVARMEEVPAG